MAQSNNIYTIKKGEKYPIFIKIKNLDEDKPIDLTNANIRVHIKDELKDEFFIIEKYITANSDISSVGRIVNPQNGELILKFNDEDFDKLVCERLYYITIWWEIPSEDFAKVISSNYNEYLMLKVCNP